MMKGFTLIELLIVVAIIAILAAIAIPNFLLAQTRSKVSKTYADMRTMATGMESYRVDYDGYPHDADDQPLGPGFDCDHCLVPLTTPIVYLSKIPKDQFTDMGGNPWHPKGSYAYLSMVPSQSGITVYDVSPRGWGIASCGPNRIWDFAFYISNHAGLYDPTNGTISNGDILRTDKGFAHLLPAAPGITK